MEGGWVLASRQQLQMPVGSVPGVRSAPEVRRAPGARSAPGIRSAPGVGSICAQLV